MKLIGITGGIGSGKSTVARMLLAMQYPVYDADKEAKGLMHTAVLKSQLTQQFGAETYINGVLNRPYLANQVFNNADKLAALNAIVHPALARHSIQWAKDRFEEGHQLVFKEAAILYESGGEVTVDEVMLVAADEAIRIDRVVERDQVEAADVQARINNQWSQEKKLALADHVIWNNNKDALIPQLNAFLLKVSKVQ